MGCPLATGALEKMGAEHGTAAGQDFVQWP